MSERTQEAARMTPEEEALELAQRLLTNYECWFFKDYTRGEAAQKVSDAMISITGQLARSERNLSQVVSEKHQMSADWANDRNMLLGYRVERDEALADARENGRPVKFTAILGQEDNDIPLGTGRCGACSKFISPGSRYCPKCGVSLTWVTEQEL